MHGRLVVGCEAGMGERTVGAQEAILRAFWTLYRQKPLDQIQVTEVVRAARVHRSTFYRHFDDLRGALDALEDQTVTSIVEALRQGFPQDESTNAASVADALREMVELHAEHAYFFRLRGEARFEERLVEEASPLIRGLLSSDVDDEVADYLIRVALSTFLTSMAYAYGLSLSEAPEAPYQSTMRIFMGDIVPSAIS